MLLSEEVGSDQRKAGRFFVGLPGAAQGGNAGVTRDKWARLPSLFCASGLLNVGGDVEANQSKVVERMAFNVHGSNTWYVDMSDVRATFDYMRSVLTQEQFERLMYRTFNEVGRKSKTLIAREVRKEYAAPYGWVQQHIQHFRLSFGGSFPVTCIIPISSTKGVIGDVFKLSGRKRKISAKILKGSISTLPKKMKNQGGNPPFVASGRAYTRRTNARFPIVRVVALADPQMPMNRASAGVQSQLLNFTATRLEHNFAQMFGR